MRVFIGVQGASIPGLCVRQACPTGSYPLSWSANFSNLAPSATDLLVLIEPPRFVNGALYLSRGCNIYIEDEDGVLLKLNKLVNSPHYLINGLPWRHFNWWALSNCVTQCFIVKDTFLLVHLVFIPVIPEKGLSKILTKKYDDKLTGDDENAVGVRSKSSSLLPSSYFGRQRISKVSVVRACDSHA